MQGFMNLKEISIGNLEGVQDLMQVGCLVTNRRGGHELSPVSLETLRRRWTRENGWKEERGRGRGKMGGI